MRIGIDSRRIQHRPTGVGRYLINLLHEWSRSDPDLEYLLFFSSPEFNDSILNEGCFSRHVLDERVVGNAKTLWEQIYLPLYLRRLKLDVFFSPNYLLPIWMSTPGVVTIHDISYTAVPEEYPRMGRLKYHSLSKWAAQHARAVITPSQFSRQEIIKHYRVDESKIYVIPLAAERVFMPRTGLQALKAIQSKYNLHDPYFFYIGTIFPRRNVPILIKAFKQVVAKHKEAKLLIVGQNHLMPKINLLKMVDELGLMNHIIWKTYVPEEDLVPLYCAAWGLVYPSTYEGFGLPVLEAMACGVPVITTWYSSIPEVAGDAAMYINPYNLNELAQGMIDLLEDNRLRAQMREKGLKQAGAFSWERTARETLDVLKSTVKD